MKSDDCSTSIHEFCNPCDCICHDDELNIALFCALVKVYDNYKTPLASSIRCFKSKSIPKDQMWDVERFIVWMEILNVDGTKIKFGYLIPNAWWDKFKIMIEYTVPDKIELTSQDVIERLMRL